VTDDDLRLRLFAKFATGVGVLLLALLASLSVGAVHIPLTEVAAWSLGQLPDTDLAGRVLAGVRLPRSLSAVVVGVGLGAAGASLQGIYRTPALDGHLIGMSAASGAGVALGYAFAPTGTRVVIAVFLGAAIGALYGLLLRRLDEPRRGPVVLVLVGIAAGMTMTAWTGIFVLAVDSPAVPTLSFFIFGSLAGATMASLAISAPLVLLGLGAVWWIGPGVDLMSLGEQQSIHVGFDAQRHIPVALAAIGVAVGASVALGGVIGFVGRISPLALRPLFGPTQRLLIPASAIGGAIAVLAFDVASRTLAAPVEIPIGLLTAAVGGPTLVWLVRREMSR
jgi:iron complex transport system permease protein